MQRTISHNDLVREAARGVEGMCRPPSYEKLSRACRSDYAALLESQALGMVGSNSSEDLLRCVMQQSGDGVGDSTSFSGTAVKQDGA